MDKKDYYKILGVEKGANQEEIKKAYRRKAMQVHPDRPGADEEQMALLNEAYACLADHERRETYDTTGKDQPVDMWENLAREILVKIFMQILETGQLAGCLQYARQIIQQQLSQLNENKKQGEEKKRAYKKMKNKIKVKKGLNLFDTLIDQMLANIEEGMGKIEKEVKMREVALEMLDGYSTSDEFAAMVALPNYSTTHTVFIRGL